MEHGIVLKTYQDFTIPEVVPEIPRRQSAIVPCDLNVAVVDCALKALGGLNPEESAYLVASEDCRGRALVVGKEFRLPVILLPPEIMQNGDCWAVVAAKGSFFSCPTW